MPAPQVRGDMMNDVPDFCQAREPFSCTLKLIENIVISLIHSITFIQNKAGMKSVCCNEAQCVVATMPPKRKRFNARSALWFVRKYSI